MIRYIEGNLYTSRILASCSGFSRTDSLIPGSGVDFQVCIAVVAYEHSFLTKEEVVTL